MSKTFLFALVFSALLLISPVLAQSPQQRPALTKADQIAMAIDLLWNVRASVTKFEQQRRLRLFKAVSVRVTECGFIYGLLSNTPSYDAQTKASFSGASDAFLRAGSFLFPEPLNAYRTMALETKSRLERLHIQQDERGVLALLQSCKALVGTEAEAHTAVTELSL